MHTYEPIATSANGVVCRCKKCKVTKIEYHSVTRWELNNKTLTTEPKCE